MADFSTLIATLQATIKTNYNQKITGQILQDDLLAMVNTINQLKQDTLEGYGFYGAPLADGASVNVTQNTFFLVGPGTYTINGEANTIAGAGISVLVYDSVNDEVRVDTLISYDTTPTAASKNAITSGAVHTALAAKQDKDTDAVAGNVAVMNASGDSEDGGVPLSDLATKAEVAVVAGEAGLAEAVIDTDNAGTEQEFAFRKSGGDGGAYYRKIKGKTLAWNQLNANPAPATPVNVNAGGQYLRSVDLGGSAFSIPAGHTALLKALIKLSAGEDAKWKIFANGGSPVGGTETAKVSSPVTSIQEIATLYVAPTLAITSGLIINSAAFANDDTITVLGYNVFDLTREFGPGNEPTTIEEFEALYHDAYYPYNPGALISNDAEAVETTGVNQWDEEWELDLGNRVRSKNFIPVFQNTAYYFKMPNTGAAIDCYDANYNLIYTFYDVLNYIFTTPNGTAFIKIVCGDGYGATYNNDICINLSNPAINGQYFPYWKRTVQLGLTTKKDTDGNVPFADGMKGAGTAADWADKVGGEKRMGRVDLGSLAWTAWSSEVFYASIPDIKNAQNIGVICSAPYNYAGDANVGAMNYNNFAINSPFFGGTTIDFKVSGYADAAAFKAAMNGVYLDYELATPVPFTWAEPLNLGVKVDENGTERAVAPEGATAPSAPFVADTTYTMSVARMVEKLQNL